jgi:hypothetical protein
MGLEPIDLLLVLLPVLLLITLLNANLIYLRLEGTLSDPVIFYHSEISTIRRIVIDILVKI